MNRKQQNQIVIMSFLSQNFSFQRIIKSMIKSYNGWINYVVKRIALESKVPFPCDYLIFQKCGLVFQINNINVVVQLLSHVWLFCDPMDCSPASLLCPWNFTGKNTGVGCHFLLQGTFSTQGSNPCLLHWQVDSSTGPPGKPNNTNTSYLFLCCIMKIQFHEKIWMFIFLLN